MEIFVTKDEFNINFFKDIPDILKFSDDEIEWTGYPFDFGDFKEVKNYFIEKYKDMKPFTCIKVVIDPSKFNTSKFSCIN